MLFSFKIFFDFFNFVRFLVFFFIFNIIFVFLRLFVFRMKKDVRKRKETLKKHYATHFLSFTNVSWRQKTPKGVSWRCLRNWLPGQYILCQNKLKLYSPTDFTPWNWFFEKKNQIFIQFLKRFFFGIFVFDPFWRPIT